MKKIFLLCILCLLLTGCAAPAEKTAVSPSAITFTDDLGRSVTVDCPERTAALLGSFAQVWQLAGGQVIAAPDDAWDDLQLDLPEEAVNLGNVKQLSLELLLGCQPDFILASTNTLQNMQWQETLEATNIPVAYFDVDDFDDYLHILSLFTDITGRKDLYQTHGEAVAREIQQILARVPEKGPKVLSLVASASAIYAKNSQGNVMGTMLKNLNCINIADSEETLLEQLSMEYILQEDPDYIFIVQRGDDEDGMRAYVTEYLMGHPGWSNLTAVKNNRVFFMDKALYNLKPNHRWAEAYEKLEAILYDA